MHTSSGALPVTFGLMIGSLVHAQTAPVPNVQTTEVAPPRAPPAASSDPRGITTADLGSSIDKPATVGAMPQTGYHEPVIGKPIDPPPHTRTRDAAMAPAVSEPDARPDRPRSRSKQRRAKRPS